MSGAMPVLSEGTGDGDSDRCLAPLLPAYHELLDLYPDSLRIREQVEALEHFASGCSNFRVITTSFEIVHPKLASGFGTSKIRDVMYYGRLRY